VSEDDHTVERTVEAEAEADAEKSRAGESAGVRDGEGSEAPATTASSYGSESFDRTAERFLDLEADLGDGSGAVDAETGIVVGVERVDAGAVPETYPIEGDPEQALALSVDVGGTEVPTYVAWPGGEAEVAEWRRKDGDGRLGRLLSAAGVGLGDLYGRRVPLERVDGQLRVAVPPETPRSSGDWGVGVVAGQALNAVVLGLVALGTATGGVSPLLLGAVVLLSLVGLPYVTWKDAWYLRTHSDAREGPPFWAALAAVPGVNLLAAVEYLRRRRAAQFYGDEPSLPTRLARRLRSLL